MKRKIICLILALVCVLLPILSVSATEGIDYIRVDGGEFAFDRASGTILYYLSNEYDLKTLIIPDKLDGVAVTAIADGAFSYADAFETVTLPNGLKHIGDSAFENSDALKSITIPDSVTSIGDGAFAYCRNLESATLGNGLTAIPNSMFCYCESLMHISFGANIESIGDYAFSNCNGLTKLTLPEALKTIGCEAFQNCDWLTEVTFGNKLETIGATAFDNCDALKSVTIPDSVKTICDFAFSRCNELTSIAIGKGLSSLGKQILAYSNKLTSITVDPANAHFSADEYGVLFNKDKTELIVFPTAFTGAYTIPDTVTDITEYAFAGCLGLTEVTFGKNVKTIGTSAFDACGLTSLTIPNSVTHIGEQAFAYCAQLTDIAIGSGVESIGDNAFLYCDSLTSIHVDPENKHYRTDAEGVLYGTDKLIRAPETISGTYTVADGTKAIGAKAFSLCAKLEGIVLPNSVETIERNAFSHCVALKTAIIPEGVKHIDDEAFKDCEALDNITLPDSLVSIGCNVFLGTAHYSDRSKWDEKILYIGKHLIESESTMSKIVVKEGTRTIAGNAFDFCDSTGITMPDSLVSISDCAFYCANFTTITLPKNVAYLGKNVFDCCFSLTSITVDAENKDFCSDAFGVLYNKSKTALIHLPNSYSAQRYEIPNGVEIIFEGAINNAGTLQCLTIPKTVTKIERCYFPDEIFYTGSEADWNKIDIDETSEYYLEGLLIFNYVPVDQLPATIPFKDVKMTDYFATPVLWASANKITSGVSETNFSPNAACTRAQIVTFLWRTKGCPEPTITENPFKDVKASDYYYKAVLWAYENYIIFGISEDTFAPNAPCTRGQVATVLFRTSNGSYYHETENPFADVHSEDYFYDGILWAYENGITDGVGGRKFAPNATCTRAQIVTFLFRAIA